MCRAQRRSVRDSPALAGPCGPSGPVGSGRGIQGVAIDIREDGALLLRNGRSACDLGGRCGDAVLVASGCLGGVQVVHPKHIRQPFDLAHPQLLAEAWPFMRLR